MENNQIILAIYVISLFFVVILIYLINRVNNLLIKTKNTSVEEVKTLINDTKTALDLLIKSSKQEQNQIIGLTTMSTRNNVKDFITNIENTLNKHALNLEHNFGKIQTYVLESVETHNSNVSANFKEINRHLYLNAELLENNKVSISIQYEMIEKMNKQINDNIKLNNERNLLNDQIQKNIIENIKTVARQNNTLQVLIDEKDRHIKKLEQMLTRKNKRLIKMEEKKNEN